MAAPIYEFKIALKAQETADGNHGQRWSIWPQNSTNIEFISKTNK